MGWESNVQTNKQFEINNEVVTDKHKFVSSFNVFYVTLGPGMAGNIPIVDNEQQDYLQGCYVNSFYLNPVGKDELRNVVKQRHYVRAGLDGSNDYVI